MNIPNVKTIEKAVDDVTPLDIAGTLCLAMAQLTGDMLHDAANANVPKATLLAAIDLLRPVSRELEKICRDAAKQPNIGTPVPNEGAQEKGQEKEDGALDASVPEGVTFHYGGGRGLVVDMEGTVIEAGGARVAHPDANNYKVTNPNAPDACITFSHARGTWLASWFGQWVAASPEDVRRLFDKGWRLLDA